MKMKKMILTVFIILCCGQGHAFVSSSSNISFNDVTIWVMIPDDDSICLLATYLTKDKNGGLNFQLEAESLYIEQNVSAISSSTARFADKLRKMLNFHLAVYLDFENGLDKFETIEKIMKTEEY